MGKSEGNQWALPKENRFQPVKTSTKTQRCRGRVGLNGGLFKDLGYSFASLEPPIYYCVCPSRRGERAFEQEPREVPSWMQEVNVPEMRPIISLFGMIRRKRKNFCVERKKMRGGLYKKISVPSKQRAGESGHLNKGAGSIQCLHRLLSKGCLPN